MRDERRTLRLIAAGVALVVGLVSAIAVLVLADWAIGFVGVPVATILGGVLAPTLRPERPRTAYAALLMAGGCTTLGALATSLIAVGDVPGALGLTLIGLVLFGAPAFGVLVIPAMVWATITANQLERRLGHGPVMPADPGVPLGFDLAGIEPVRRPEAR